MENVLKNIECSFVSKHLQIPDGTKPLEHQVAGHVFGRLNGHKKDQIGFLQDRNGFVLKPVQGGAKGLREVRFYEFISADAEDDDKYKKIISEYLSSECVPSHTNPHALIVTDEMCRQLRGLKKFVPKFYGLWSTPVHPGIPYMRLENVTGGMRKACVMDVKVGCVTYDRYADEAKANREHLKCSALKLLCFQLLGIKVFCSRNKKYHVLERNFLRSLDQHNIIDQGLRVFFNGNLNASQSLLKVFLKRLECILNWFRGQRTLTFISSSLLFVYDACVFDGEIIGGDGVGGSASDRCGNDGNVNKAGSVNVGGDEDDSVNIVSNDGISKDQPTDFHINSRGINTVGSSVFERMTELRMIDFTHVFADGETTDVNYLDGLENLIGYLENMVG